jgi:DNA-binding response OmpR family regulator
MPVSSAAPAAAPALEVLVIDDDEQVCAHLDRILSAAGVGSLSVTCIESARAAMEAVYFPLIIVDRYLDRDDGIALCREYRLKYSHQVRIAILSVADSEHDVQTGLAAGADEYWSKRISEDELTTRIIDLLKAARGENARSNKRALATITG